LPPRHRWLDRQGFSTLFAGALLLLISFTTNYGDDNLLKFRGLPAAIQIGIYLHIAALAALAGVDEVFSEGVVQLATRLRHRARIRTAEDQIARERETDARKREVSLPRFHGQCLESCFYTDPMKTNDHNECPFYATPLQR